MDAQTELERALTLIDDLVQYYSGLEDSGLLWGTLMDNEFTDCIIVKGKAEDFLRKHKRIP